jgi:transcription initiation factor TFIIIB Brf1 subunit/transcription initiation factor TFIIB
MEKKVKVCNRCKQEKSLDEFGKRKDSPDGRKYYCKPCATILARQQRERKPELESKRQKAYYYRNREAQIAKAAKWNRENAERRNKRVRESGQGAAVQARRRRRNVAWADEKAITRIYAAANRISRDTGIPHEVDHVIPLQGRKVSGLHVETNLQIIPMPVNRAKGNKLPRDGRE